MAEVQKGQLIKNAAAESADSTRILSIRHDFPTAWARFLAVTPPAGSRAELTFDVRPSTIRTGAERRLPSPGSSSLPPARPPTP